MSEPIEVYPDHHSPGYSVNFAEIRALPPDARKRLSAWQRRVGALPVASMPSNGAAALGTELRKRGAQLEMLGGDRAVVRLGTFEATLKVSERPSHLDPTRWQMFRAAFEPATPVAKHPHDAWLRGCTVTRGRHWEAWKAGVWTLATGEHVGCDGSEVRWAEGPPVEARTFHANVRKVRGIPQPPDDPGELPASIPEALAPVRPLWRCDLEPGALKLLPGEHIAWHLTARHVSRPAVSGARITATRLDWPPSAQLVESAGAVAFSLDRLRKIVGKHAATLTIGALTLGGESRTVLRVDFSDGRHALLMPHESSAALDLIDPLRVLDKAEDRVIECLENLTEALTARKQNADSVLQVAAAISQLNAADAEADKAREALRTWNEPPIVAAPEKPRRQRRKAPEPAPVAVEVEITDRFEPERPDVAPAVVVDAQPIPSDAARAIKRLRRRQDREAARLRAENEHLRAA